MRRVLKPSGWLVMADVVASPVWRSFSARVAQGLMVYFGITHSRSRFRAEANALANLRTRRMAQSLDASGFVDVQITAFRPYDDSILMPC